MAHILGALIVLPFILFAPLSGWLSDRFSKTYVIRGTLCMQLGVLVMIVFAVAIQSLPLAVLGFFLLSVESVLLSPAKKGIVKELVGHSRLGFASGVLEMSVILAVCFGQIISGWWYDLRREAGFDVWEAAHFPMMVIAAAALLSLALSFKVECVKPMSSRPFRKGILIEHFGQLNDLWEDRRMRLSGVGVAFFWGFAGFINLAAIQIGSDLSGGGGVGFGSENSWLMLAASGGIALGGVMASLICKKKIELGLVPLGGLVMMVGSVALGLGPIERVWLMTWLAIAGGGGALLLVPLNAYLQDICPPEKRGRVLAGLNLLDCIAGFFAVLIQFVMAHYKLPYSFQFGALALVCVMATNYSARLLPQHVVRLVVLGLFKMVYRIRVLHADRVPAQGGVLLIANHVSYVDAFVLSVACPRKVRFLMYDGYFKRPWIGRFVKLFDTVPISETRAKEALRVAAEALEKGSVVCVFPEGQLARTGAMNEFKRGFEMIARKAKCPVLPAAMDGLWGSIFSFERNRFLFKWPYRIPYGVTVHFGSPLITGETKVDQATRAVESLRADAFAQRQVLAHPMKWLSKNARLAGGDVSAFRQRANELRALPVGQQVQRFANALQVGEVNAIRRGQTVMFEWDSLESCRDVLGVIFAQYFKLKLVLVSSTTSADEVSRLSEEHRVDHYVSGKSLHEAWRSRGLSGGCYDFSHDALNRDGVFPCLAVGGCIIAMSMPHPEAETATNQHQEGHRSGTWGRLLPGFHVEIKKSVIHLTGVSLPPEGLSISNVCLDPNGILGPALDA
ncbi:MAG: MFS transporter [Verrucomicrobiae bacterium]|nr:MFS transporter [Verrucomicrobiae bacterium]NNJ43131.1 MFS transporter [Akkermansiaceae bacterium]